MPSANIPHYTAAVDRAGHNDTMQTANANASDNTNMPKHAFLQGERARAVGPFQVLPYRYSAVNRTRYNVRAVVRDGAGSYWARVHVLKQVGQLVHTQVTWRDDGGVEPQSAIRFLPRNIPAKKLRKKGRTTNVGCTWCKTAATAA